MSKKIKLIFLSSSDFGIPILKKLVLDARFLTLALITLPDRPKGRGMKTIFSPIKKTALDLGIKVLEFEKGGIQDLEEEIKQIAPDIMLIASFGKIIPASFLNIPPCGVLNIHPSLLPKFRGPSPIQSAILEGKKETGVTIILTDEKTDHGPILKISNLKSQISKISYTELHNKLAGLGAEMICGTVFDWVSGKIKAVAQNESEATYTKKIKKEDGKVDWNDSATAIERKIRAYKTWPTAYFFIEKDGNIIRIQVLEAAAVNFNELNKKAGEFFEAEGSFAAQTGNGILKLIKIKPESKKEMSGKDFLRGYKKFLNLKQKNL